MKKENTISRRSALGGLGAVLATSVINPVFSAEIINEDASAPQPEDPTTKYPRPPFKAQTQSWPGLASKMEPRPDHGEKKL